MSTTHELQTHNHIIQFQLTYRAQKNLVLRFREGKVLVSAPYHCTLPTVKKFVSRNWEKIRQCEINFHKHQKISLVYPTWVMIWNHPVAIQLTSQLIRTKWVGNQILLHNSGNNELMVDELHRFLGREFKKWFFFRTQHWAEILKVSFKGLSVRKMVSKWGVCYPQTQKITYNVKLIHYKVEVIDYVIVHELAHLIHSNHSIHFWREVEKYLPNYQELKAQLRYY